LANLKYLILTGNKFEEFPAILLQMQELVTIVLSKNQLTKTVALSAMAELKELDLFMNKVEEISFEKRPPKLHTLILRANKLTKISPQIAELMSLTHLDISNNDINTLSPLENCGSLTKLECAGCQLESLQIFAQYDLSICKTLKNIVVSRNHQITLLPDLQMPQLTEFRAVGCNIERTSTLEHCPLLRILDLDNNPIRDRADFRCPRLEMLGLCNTKVTETPMLVSEHTTELALANACIIELPPTVPKSLQRLYLQENHISELPAGFIDSWELLKELSLRQNSLSCIPLIGNAAFGAGLVNLDLSGNQLHELPPRFFQSMKSLTKLDLSDNYFPVLPISLYGCTRLGFLNIFANNLKYLAPELGNLLHLREFYAGNNELSSLPEEMSIVSQLRVLHLAGNTLSNISLALPHLEKLYLGRNLIDQFPSGLSKCPNLEALDLSGNQIHEIAFGWTFPRLQELILSHNQLSLMQFSSEAQAHIPQLVCLDLSCNPLTSIPKVSGIPTLEIVNLMQCHISNLTAEKLEKFSNISIIYMQGNPIEKVHRNIPLRVSFVERKTDLLISDLYKTNTQVGLFNRLRNPAQEAFPMTASSVATADSSKSEYDENGKQTLGKYQFQPPTISWSEIKGARTTQEDTISVNTSDADATHLYAVFDGHRGSEVSKFCAAQFPALLHINLSQPNMDLVKAIERTFATLAQKIVMMQLSDGATAAVTLIQEDTIAMAHLGDARVVLFSDCPERKDLHTVDDEDASTSSISTSAGGHKHMTRKAIRSRYTGQSVLVIATMDHTAKNRMERKRVEQDLGGYVSEQGHIMGDCAVTRALGDTQFSPFVTNTPSIVVLPRSGREAFLIVACDGFWDTCTNEKAHAIVVEHLKNNGDHHKCALLLRDYSLSMGSLDNISVLCIIFSAKLAVKSSTSRKDSSTPDSESI
jgi:Leucine-rich repeat (LRR) protein/serine/threonine protein phosphatase PrpC